MAPSSETRLGMDLKHNYAKENNARWATNKKARKGHWGVRGGGVGA